MENNHRGQLTTASDMLYFALAGNATLTLVSEKTGTRYTYRVRKPKKADESAPYFVAVMCGPDNESNYAYMGVIWPNRTYAHGKKSTLDKDDVRSLAWRFFWQHVANGQTPPKVEVWHEGHCGRCGRKLTVPESIARGIGPECSKQPVRAWPRPVALDLGPEP